MKGMTDYNEIIVGILTDLILLSVPIMCTFGLCLYLLKKGAFDSRNKRSFVSLIANTTLFIQMLEMTVFTIFLTVLRQHLFIWTVFSPKYIYELFFFFVFEVSKNFPCAD